MKKLVNFVLGTTIVVMLLTVSGCAAPAPAPSGNGVTPTTAPSNNQQSGSKESVFDFYNRVNIEQTKSQVDKELGVKGTESTQLKNSFTYTDQNTGFGVSVWFNEKDVATAKTLIYPSNESIAFLTIAPVTQAQADQIKKGMTYDAVKTLLGGEGTEMNATQISFNNNKISYIRSWVNTDGSKIQIVFGTDGLSNDAMFF